MEKARNGSELMNFLDVGKARFMEAGRRKKDIVEQLVLIRSGKKSEVGSLCTSSSILVFTGTCISSGPTALRQFDVGRA